MNQKLSALPTKTVQIICAFCKGKGVDPFGIFSKLSACPVCQGRRKVMASNPNEKCPACKGKGVFTNSRLPCAVCGGKGVAQGVKRHVRCGECKGGGINENTGLPCATCYDLGML